MAALMLATPLTPSRRGGRPPTHPLADDYYKLVASKLTIIIIEVVDDEVHCRYATSGEEAQFSVRWLRGHADLLYKRKPRSTPDVPVATEFTDTNLVGGMSANSPC